MLNTLYLTSRMLHLVIHFFERAANNVSNIRPEDDLLNVEARRSEVQPCLRGGLYERVCRYLLI